MKVFDTDFDELNPNRMCRELYFAPPQVEVLSLAKVWNLRKELFLPKAQFLAVKSILRPKLLLVVSFLFFMTGQVAAQNLTIGNYSLVKDERVGRTVFNYTYRAEITNTGPAIRNVTATVKSTSAHTVVVDGTLTFGDVPAGRTVTSKDTFTIQDRRFPFDPQALVWEIHLPLNLHITAPPNGAVFRTQPITAMGTIGDNAVTVTVNGVTATVSNGRFFADVPLRRDGGHIITAVATDTAGNTDQTSTMVVLDTMPPILVIDSPPDGFSTTNETMAIAGTVSDAITVNPTITVNGIPAAVDNGSFIAMNVPLSAGPNQITARATDGVGNGGGAAAQFTLGARTGAGNNRVQVSVTGGPSFVEFCATTTNGSPDRITIIPMGNQQAGVVGRTLTEPFAALVSDERGNPVAGVPVRFEVVEGGGNFDGNAKATVTTGADGVARAWLTLGADAGTQNNVVAATFEGGAKFRNIGTAAFVEQTGPGVEFVASGVTPGPVANTTFSGIVLDNGDVPLPHARAVIAGTNREAFTDAGGQFQIKNVPPGSHRLFIDGSAINDPPRVYPDLEFDVNVFSGTDNSLPFPIYLPPLADAVVITGTETKAVTLKMPGVPEATLTIFPGSVRRADGSKPTPENPIRVRFSRVNNERVPMPPPNGSAFMLAWTVQPAGTQFDPPAAICVPNAGMPPGAQVDIYSFDHDVGQFLNIGLATVSEDGSVICSNPGFGIRKAGWGGCTPPPPPTTEPKNCRVVSVVANPNPVSISEGASLSDEVVITATTDPSDKTVTWSGDLGDVPVISGNTLRTRYGTGDKAVTATCEQSSNPVTVKVIAPKVEMTAYRPQRVNNEAVDLGRFAIPDEQEEDVGAGIRLNGDNRNSNLIEVELKVSPAPPINGVQFFLKRT